MATLAHKTFTGPTIYWGFRRLNYYREQIRAQAEAFVNDEVGIEKVVSIAEHAMSFGPFSVVVWYRTGE